MTSSYIDTSYYSNTGLRKVELTTSDGLFLDSLFMKPSNNEQSTIVVFHGNAGHIGHRVEKFRPFFEQGYGLLLVEYRGYGNNSGKPTESNFYKDGQAAFDFLSEQNISKQKNNTTGCSSFVLSCSKLNTTQLGTYVQTETTKTPAAKH